MYKISFCIPTYNRAEYLVETLNCLMNQADESIEIVVSDNCSTDNTEKVVMDALKKFKNIKYFKWEKNMGADLNYLKAVELAQGEFCWFMGSDDLITSDAIRTVKLYLNDDVDIALCSQFICTKDMLPIKEHFLLGEGEPDKLYELSKDDQAIEYFNKAKSHSAMFGYLSTIIFRKKCWDEVVYDESYTGTLYSHMFMLYSFLYSRLNLQYIKKPLVYWRGGNDSFGGKGKIVQRFLIDFNGFKKINERFFFENKNVSLAFKNAFRRHHHVANIAYLRLNTKLTSDWNLITKLAVNDFNYPRYIFLLLSPKIIKGPLYIVFLANRMRSSFMNYFVR